VISELSLCSKQMQQGILKASDDLANQLDDLRALKLFVAQKRQLITEQQLQRQYIG